MLLLLFSLLSIHCNQAGQATFGRTPLSELMHKSIHEIDSLLKDFQQEIQKEKSVLRAVDLEIQDAGLPDYSMSPVWWRDSPGSNHTGSHIPTTFFPYPPGYFTTTTKDPWESWNLPGLEYYSTSKPSEYVPSPGHLPDFGYPLNHTPFNPFATIDRTMPLYGPTNMNYSASFTRPSLPSTAPSRTEPTSPNPYMSYAAFNVSYSPGSPTFKLPTKDLLPGPAFMRSVTARHKARTLSAFSAMLDLHKKAFRDRTWYRPRGRPMKANRMTAPTRRPQQRKRTLSKAQAWVQNRQWMKTKKPGRTIQGHMREGKDGPPPEPKPIAVGDPPPEPKPIAVGDPPPEPKPIAVGDPPPEPNPIAVGDPPPEPNPIAVGDPPPEPNPIAVGDPPPEPKPIAVGDPPPEPRPIAVGDSLSGTTAPLVTASIPALKDILPSMSIPGLDEASLTTAVSVSVSSSTTKNPLAADTTTIQTAFTEELLQEDDAGFLFVKSPATIHVPVTERTTNTFGQILFNADNFTASTPGAPPHQAYHELMEALDEGYLTVFLLELTRLVAQKAPRDAGEVLAHVEVIYNNLYEKGSVAFFGEEILELGSKVSRMFSGNDISILQSQANMMNQMLKGRAQFLSVEVNSIIDYADLLFEDDEGEDLLEAVRMFEAFPNAIFNMCNSKVEKDEVFLDQNAAGGNNDALLKDIGGHMERLNTIIIIILVAIFLLVIYLFLKYYRNCHRQWIQEEIGVNAIQRIRSSLRGRVEEGVSSYDVCRNLIESFIKPYRRLRSTDRLRKLVHSILKVIATKFGKRRRGDKARTEPNKTTYKKKRNAPSLRRKIEMKRHRMKRPRQQQGNQYNHRRQVYDAAPPILRNMLPITKHQKRFRVMTPKQLRSNGYMSMVRPTVAYFRRRLGRPLHPENGVLQLFPQARDVEIKRRAQPADDESNHLKETAPQQTPGAMRDEVRRIVEESSYSDEEASLKMNLRHALRVNWHRTSTPSLKTAEVMAQKY